MHVVGSGVGLVLNLSSDTHIRTTRKKKSKEDAMAPYTMPWISPLMKTLERELLSEMRGKRVWLS